MTIPSRVEWLGTKIERAIGLMFFAHGVMPVTAWGLDVMIKVCPLPDVVLRLPQNAPIAPTARSRLIFILALFAFLTGAAWLLWSWCGGRRAGDSWRRQEGSGGNDSDTFGSPEHHRLTLWRTCGLLVRKRSAAGWVVYSHLQSIVGGDFSQGIDAILLRFVEEISTQKIHV